MSNYYPGIQFTQCDLHIPYKRWGGNPQEEQNYEAIEQWALRQKACWPKPGGGTVTVSRVHYSVYNSVTVPGDGTQIWFDFLDNPTAVGDKYPSTGGALNPLNNGMQLTAEGFLGYQGSVRWDGLTGTAAQWCQALVGIVGSSISDEHREPLAATGVLRTNFGGGYYLANGAQWRLGLSQNSGVAYNASVAVGLALLNFGLTVLG